MAGRVIAPDGTLETHVDGEGLDAVLARIDESAATTQSALVATREALDEVERAAHGYVSALRAAMAEFAGTDGAALNRNFQRLESAIETYLNTVESEVALQTDVARNAAAHCDAVLSAADRIVQVAFTTRLLSLNATARAARVKNGAALGVIVQEITSLSGGMDALARSAISAAKALIDVLPGIAALAAELFQEAKAFSDEFRVAVAKLGPASAELQSRVALGLEQSNECMRHLVTTSRRALQALEFEPSFVQRLETLRAGASELRALLEHPPSQEGAHFTLQKTHPSHSIARQRS